MAARLAILLTLSLLMTAGPLSAAISYPDSLGAAAGEVDFLSMSESSTTDALPLFGAPVRSNNTLTFVPTSFSSAASNGSADTTSGTFQVIIQADAGQYLDGITILESGNYALSVVSAGTTATPTGAMFVTDLTPGVNGTIPQTLTILKSLPDFSGFGRVDLAGLGIQRVQLSFNNNLQTTSETGTTASVSKTGLQIIVPEPLSLAVLGLGGLVLLRRRR